MARKLKTLLTVVGAALVVVLACGCNPTPGEGLFEAAEFNYEGCGNPLPWEPGFFTISKFEGNVTIRLQDIGGGISEVDGIFIQIDQAYIESHMGEDIPLGVAIDDEGTVVAEAVMGFYNSCPNSRVTPELIGKIRFGRFSVNNGKQITGQVVAPQIVNKRDGRVIGRDLDGYFNFLVQRGRPYTNFTGPGEEQSPF